jgi:hypothetical protein
VVIEISVKCLEGRSWIYGRSLKYKGGKNGTHPPKAGERARGNKEAAWRPLSVKRGGGGGGDVPRKRKGGGLPVQGRP